MAHSSFSFLMELYRVCKRKVVLAHGRPVWVLDSSSEASLGHEESSRTGLGKQNMKVALIILRGGGRLVSAGR